MTIREHQVLGFGDSGFTKKPPPAWEGGTLKKTLNQIPPHDHYHEDSNSNYNYNYHNKYVTKIQAKQEHEILKKNGKTNHEQMTKTQTNGKQKRKKKTPT